MRARLLLLALLALPGTLRAQWAEPGSRLPPAHAAAAPAVAAPAAPRDALVLGGISGGLLGVLAGGAAGYMLETRGGGCEGDAYFCGVAGGLGGALLGEIIGLPLGVHLANGRRGSLPLELLASAGIALGGLLVASGALATDHPLVVYSALAAIPLLQLEAGIALERR